MFEFSLYFNMRKIWPKFKKTQTLCISSPMALHLTFQIQEELMAELPNWKQRIAGKSIPMEKYAILKARRFLDQKNRLVLPVLELIYLWNGFKLIGSSFKTVEPFYQMVEKAFQEHHKGKLSTAILCTRDIPGKCSGNYCVDFTKNQLKKIFLLPLLIIVILSL